MRIVLVTIGKSRRTQAAIGKLQANRFGHSAINRRGKADMRGGNRAAGSFAIGAAALPVGDKSLAHGEVKPLVAARRLAVAVSDRLGPDQRHVMFGRQRAAALERDHAGERGAARVRLGGKFVTDFGLRKKFGAPPIAFAQCHQNFFSRVSRQHVNR